MKEIDVNGNKIILYQEMKDEQIQKLVSCNIVIADSATGNKVIISEGVKLGYKVKIIFQGDNNIFFIAKNAVCDEARIEFHKSNALCYLSRADIHTNYKSCSIHLGDESVFYIGRNGRINNATCNRFLALENQNIIIGDNTLFSNDIIVRTNDAHIIYDLDTKKRINFSGSIYIGDHVWISNGVNIYKNVKIGSGSIVGGKSLVIQNSYASNSLIVGIPARIIKKVIMDRQGTSYFSPEESAKYVECVHDDWIYAKDDKTLDMELLDGELKCARKSEEKLDLINLYLVGNTYKNKLAI